MVKLIQEKIEKLTMPSGATVEVDTAVSGGLAEDIFDEQGQMKAPVSSILYSLIKSWDYEDGEGNIEPITHAKIRRLPPQDFNYLSERIMPQLGVIAEAQVSPAEKKD